MDTILNDNIIEKEDLEPSLRPLKLNDYIGQTVVKEKLDIYIKAAKIRNESLDHVLLYGPPGLGKTTLAQIIANELGVNIKTISGPTIEKSGDLACVLTTLEEGDVLFIDEIHRVPKIVEEILYSAMEDFYIDLIIGKDSQAKSIRLDLPPFTLVGATTRYGDLSAPLRDRFGIVERLNYYNVSELKSIIKRSSEVYKVQIDDLALLDLAKRSRGTPRIANRLLRRIRDFAYILTNGEITEKLCKEALDKLNIDALGLDTIDIKYLSAIINQFKGGPVGLETIAATIGEVKETIEDVYEPYLLQEGFINRTLRGRVVTDKAYKHLGIERKDKL